MTQQCFWFMQHHRPAAAHAPRLIDDVRHVPSSIQGDLADVGLVGEKQGCMTLRGLAPGAVLGVSQVSCQKCKYESFT